MGNAVEALSDKPRPSMMVPVGLSNVARKAKITSSDKKASEKLHKMIDGIKECSIENVVSLRKGSQWVQLDFDRPQENYGIIIWHNFDSQNVCKDVVVQAGDDLDMADHVRTLFNNDQDNTSGLGVGSNREYYETYEGKLLDAKGVKARSLRFYSKGNTDSR